MSKKFFRGRITHLSMDIRSFLEQNEHQKLAFFGTIFKNDDGEFMKPYEAIAEMHAALARGEKVMSFGNCDNFDPVTGCPGHYPPYSYEL